jgi:hypothetical protein
LSGKAFLCVRAANKELIKQLIILLTAKLLRQNTAYCWNGEEMAKKGCLKKQFWVPKTLYDELVSAAKENHQTLREYLDELSVYLLLGAEFDPSVTRRV